MKTKKGYGMKIKQVSSNQNKNTAALYYFPSWTAVQVEVIVGSCELLLLHLENSLKHNTQQEITKQNCNISSYPSVHLCWTAFFDRKNNNLNCASRLASTESDWLGILSCPLQGIVSSLDI